VAWTTHHASARSKACTRQGSRLKLFSFLCLFFQILMWTKDRIFTNKKINSWDNSTMWWT
jgi:hypothetical protein